MSSDEDDVHQCGRCKQLFYDIDSYFGHKKSRSCVKVISGSLKSGSQISPSKPVQKTENDHALKNSENEIQDGISQGYGDVGDVKNHQDGDFSQNTSTGIHDVVDVSSIPATSVTTSNSFPIHVDSKPNPSNEFCSPLGGPLVSLKEVDEGEKSAVNDIVITALDNSNDNCNDNSQPALATSVRRSSRNVPKKSWSDNFTADPIVSEEPPKKKRKTTAKKPDKKVKLNSRRLSEDLPSKDDIITKGLVGIVTDTSLLEGLATDHRFYMCLKCEYSGVDEVDLNAHMQQSHPEYHCPNCNKSFASLQNLKRHMTNCSEVDSKAGHLQGERVDAAFIMKVEKDCKVLVTFNCYVCALHCSNYEDLSRHVAQQHLEIRPAICPCCNQWFSTKQQLLSHVSSGHKYIAKSEVLTIQGKVDAMEDDILWQQPTDEELLAIQGHSVKYQCTICLEIFAGSNDYERHYLHEHTTDAKYHCETCHLRFKKKIDLKNHVTSHEHKSCAFHVCEICEKTFYQASHMRRHIEALHKAKPQMSQTILSANVHQSLKVLSAADPNDKVTFPCFVCPDEFNSIEEFCRHMESHRVWVPDPEKGCQPVDLITEFPSEACSGSVRKIFAQKPLERTEDSQDSNQDSTQDSTKTDEAPQAPSPQENSQKDAEKDPQIKTLMTMFQQLSDELQDKDDGKLNREAPNQSANHVNDQTKGMDDDVPGSCEAKNNTKVDGSQPIKDVTVTDFESQGTNEESIVKTDQLLCCFCFTVFANQSDLYEHTVETHQLVLRWTCNRVYECDATFDTIDLYREHHKEVHTQGSYVCLVCNDHYHTMQHLFVHKSCSHRYLTSHFEQGEGEYKCTFCTKNFISASALSAHVKSDHRERTCGTCKKTFQTLTELKDHIATECVADHLCDQCGQVFTLKVALTKHRALHDPNRKIACNVCGREFNKREHLRRHMVTFHSDSKPFACTFEGCERSFKRRDKLQEHERSHSTKKPFKCPKCGRAYRYKEGLRYHLKTHEREEKFKCEVCGIPFPRPGQLKQHLEEEHKVERKREHIHKCNHCNTTFARPERLKRHIEREHDMSTTWKFECNVCKKGFQGEKSLQNHMKTKHCWNERHNTQKQVFDDINAKMGKVVDPAIDQQVTQVPGMDQGLSLSQVGDEFFLMTAEGVKIPLKQVQGQPIQLQGQIPIHGPQMHVQSQQTFIDSSQVQLQIQGQHVQVQNQIQSPQIQVQNQIQVQQAPISEHQYQEYPTHSTNQSHERSQGVKGEAQSHMHQDPNQSSHEAQKISQSYAQTQPNQSHFSQAHELHHQGHLEGTTIQIPDRHTDDQRILEVHHVTDSSQLQTFQADVVVETNNAQEILVENEAQTEQTLALELQQQIQQQINEQLQKEQFDVLPEHTTIQTQAVTSLPYERKKAKKEDHTRIETSQRVINETPSTLSHQIILPYSTAYSAAQTYTTTTAMPTTLLQTQLTSVPQNAIKLPLQNSQGVVIPLQFASPGQFISNPIFQQAPQHTVSQAVGAMRLPTPLPQPANIKPKPVYHATSMAQNFTISTHTLQQQQPQQQQQQIVIPVSEISAYQAYQGTPIMLNLDPGGATATVATHGDGASGGGDVQHTLSSAGLQTIAIHNPTLQ